MSFDAAIPDAAPNHASYLRRKERAARAGVCIYCPNKLKATETFRCDNCRVRLIANKKKRVEKNLNSPCGVCGNPNRLNCSLRCSSELLWRSGEVEKLAQRFWRYVDRRPGQGPKGDCWSWTGAKRGKYGQIGGGRILNYRPLGAHVASYIIHFGYIPEGLDILHSCDNHICPNPDHLRAGTDADNGHDRAMRGSLVEEVSLFSLKESDLILGPSEVESQIEREKRDELIHKALLRLNDRQREVITLRFGLYGEDEKTLEEIGQLQGCTGEYIRQLEAKALARLKHPAISRELRAALAA